MPQMEPPPGVALVDSITSVAQVARSKVAVSGSHGGAYAAACALAMGLPAAVFNDAGRGRGDAGIAGLDLLQRPRVPALAVSHDSARIGDARDGWVNGRVSAANEPALACGVRTGMAVPQACALLPRGRRTPVLTSEYAEARRTVVLAEGVDVVVVDSNSLVLAQDDGAVVVTGSHGGLLGGDPASAIRCAARAAFYNDAGLGKDCAGISRLPVLDRLGIAGVAVGAATARIGDGMSTLRDGVVSHCNAIARRLGVEPGMPAAVAARLLHLKSPEGPSNDE